MITIIITPMDILTNIDSIGLNSNTINIIIALSAEQHPTAIMLNANLIRSNNVASPKLFPPS